MILEHLLQPRVEPRAHLGRVLPEPLALHDLDVLQSHRTARRVPGVRVRVHPAVLGLDVVHGVLDVAAHHDAAQRQVAGGHALGERHDVGLDVPVREREPAPGAAEAGDHLVADEEHLALRAHLAHEPEVVVVRHQHAAAAMNRLGDERGHRVLALARDGLVEQPRRRLARRLAGPGVLLPVRVTRRDVHEARHARLEHLPVSGHARRAHRLLRHAVVGVVARDDLDLVGLALGLPVEARRLERRLVGLRPAAGEEHGLHVVVGEPDELFGELHGRQVRRARVRREVGQLLHLRRRRLGQLGAAVADVDVPQAGEPVDVALAAQRLDRRPLAAHVDHRLGVIDRVVQRVDQVLLVGLDDFGGSQRHQILR